MELPFSIRERERFSETFPWISKAWSFETDPRPDQKIDVGDGFSVQVTAVGIAYKKPEMVFGCADEKTYEYLKSKGWTAKA